MTGLIVALDAPVDRARELYDALKRDVACFKIGVPLLLEDGGQQLARDIALWSRLMLDAKIYDTRDTVLRIIEQVERIGAHLVTVHADCVAYARPATGAAAILAVSSLTDGTHAAPRAFSDAMIAADGLICSVAFAGVARRFTDKLLVCPGIRPGGTAPDNHQTTATPRQAAEAGADYIVVGRPIYTATDPVKAARAILGELERRAEQTLPPRYV